MTTFYLPDAGNEITGKDIKKGVLRITVNAKLMFPERDGEIKIQFSGITKTVAFKKVVGRSDLLHVGNDFMEKMGLSRNVRLKFTCISKTEFLIEKV